MKHMGMHMRMQHPERVLKEMKTQDDIVGGQKSSSWSAYSSLAGIYVKAQLFDKAEQALKMSEEIMERLPHKQRGRHTYHFLISLYACTCNLGEVKRVWESLKKAFPATNNMSYLIMLQALCKLNDVEGLKECFWEWESNCSGYYDMRLVNVAIRCYLSQGLYEEAALVFEDATKRSKGPFFEARELFMVHFLNIHQADLAVRHLEAAVSETEEEEWHPSPDTTSAFVKYFEEEKGVESAEQFCKIFKRLSCLSYN